MQCAICFRTGGSRLPFLCPTDARNNLYEPRIRYALMLLEREALEQQVTAAVSNTKEDRAIERPKTRYDVVELQGLRDQIMDRTEQIISQANELQVAVEKAREDLARQKATLSRRKSNLSSVSNGTDARRSRVLDDVQKSIRMTKYKWNQGHATTMSARAYLCGEAAKLYGLKKARSNNGRVEYRIGGIPIMDLRSLNTATPPQVSTVLSHIVHLLILSTNYLAIRLPAEITLPHPDYPMPTIFSLQSSYKHLDVPFPSGTQHSSSTSPMTSRRADSSSHQPHPRPLFLCKPLPQLAREDPFAHASFLEGVSLLAYNIAWACKSQGIPVGEDGGFEDICHMGRNMFNLLIGVRPRPFPGSREHSTLSTPSHHRRENDVRRESSLAHPLPLSPPRSPSPPPISLLHIHPNPHSSLPPPPHSPPLLLPSLVGKYSHGAAHSFLGSAENTELICSWKLMNPTKLLDRLRAQLMAEAATAEWEMLNADAWTANDDMDGDGVLVGQGRRGLRPMEEMGMMGLKTTMDKAADAAEAGRKVGTSGWTKLKSR